MAVTTTKTNKPINPRGEDKSPLAFNRAKIYSGKALDFDGVNDLVTMPTALTSSLSTTSVTFVTNVKTDFATWAGTRDDAFSFAERGMILAFNGGNIYYYYRHQSSGWRNLQVPNADFKPQEWNQMVTTIDLNTNTWKAYVNGVEVATSGTYSDTAIAYDANALTIGGQAGVKFFDGQIAGFKIFNTALTAAQVLDLYNNPEKIVPTGVDNTALKLWLPMMEGAGTTAYDGSGNGNHGTISGATWTHGIGAPVAQTAVIDWNKGTNLFKYSEQFEDTTRWGRTNTDFVVDDEVAPNGKTTAELIKETTANGPHYINGGIDTLASKTYVQSVWVKKKDDGIYAGIRTNGVGGNSYVIFDFDTATIVDSGSDIILKGVVPYPNGWYRIYMTYNLAPVGGIYSITNSSSSVIPSYTGTGKGYYIWGAQIAEANSLTAYIPNYTTTAITSEVLLPQGLTSGRDITGVNLFENVRKQYALNLDGQSWAEVHDNESLDVTTGLSLEGWVYVDVSKDIRGALIAKYKFTQSARAYSLELDDLTLKFILSSNGSSTTSVQGSTTISTTGWYHFVSTYDESNIKVYLNGVEDNTQAYSGGIYAQDYPVTIGVLDTASQATSIMKDQIAQPRIYNRALTADEVKQNYNAGKNTYS